MERDDKARTEYGYTREVEEVTTLGFKWKDEENQPTGFIEFNIKNSEYLLRLERGERVEGVVLSFDGLCGIEVYEKEKLRFLMNIRDNKAMGPYPFKKGDLIEIFIERDGYNRKIYIGEQLRMITKTKIQEKKT